MEVVDQKRVLPEADCGQNLEAPDSETDLAEHGHDGDDHDELRHCFVVVEQDL